jgi:DNA polymerase-3 subunit alpha
MDDSVAMSDFIHLHNHTHFSLQDAACTVDKLVKAAKKFNMPAVALTDHGVLYGVPEFYKKAKKEGIKPIVGMEAYIVLDGSRKDRGKTATSANGGKKKPYHHLILLAKNNEGYKNLLKLSSIGFLEGFYYRPRIDIETLQKYSEGLICTTACLGGIISPYLVSNEYDKARAIARQFKDMFGDDFYLEIQDHGIEGEKAMLEGMPKLSKELGIKVIATNDCHYINHEDSISHNILLLMSDKSGEADFKKLRYGTDQIYFKSSDEMKKLFGHYEGAIENTLEIAEKTDINLDDKKYHFPVFPIPETSRAKDLNEYLDELAHEGLHERYKEITPEIKERFDFELKTIKEMGYAGYFLVVQDFINAAKRMKIPVGPGRGSAAGSIVSYALKITNVDPLPFNLLFERFLNPARKTMPDIDVDFADDQRGEVIDYVRQKYGSDCVTQIVTFNTLGSRQVLRDVARVLKISIPTVNKITKFIPTDFGKAYSIERALDEVPELQWVKDSKDPEIVQLVKYAQALEGMNRNISKHAAGVVIAPDEVSKFVPLASTGDEKDIVTQFNMKEIEEFGLLKMDFLGLRTLSIIRDAIALIKKHHNVDIDIDAIPLDDEKTFQLFWRGQTTAIFQFESSQMREYLRKLKPTSVADLSAMNALYRPGPMKFIDEFIDRKFGRKKITYQDPSMETILKETFGIIVYQEQVIQIANKVGGMTLAEADNLRRAMGKKDHATMAKQKEVFVAGAKRNNISEKVAAEIFANLEEFANYGFNKSHSVAYSFVAYQTAYLKANYTAEFLAANLTNEFGNKDKVSALLDECRKLHIDVLPPDINSPTKFFDVENGKIRFGLSAIKNVGVGAVEEIIRQRYAENKKFTSLFDLCASVDTRTINKRVLEGLILAGAFDSLNANRRQLFEHVEIALQYGGNYQFMKESSQNSLFGDMSEEVHFQEPELNEIADWTEAERLAKEREVIGVYITNHPLRKYELEYRSFTDIHFGEISEDAKFPVSVKACGVVTSLQLKMDSKKQQMAFFSLDDLSGSCECIMFASTFEKYGALLVQEACLLVLASPETTGDSVKLHITDVYALEGLRDKMTRVVKLFVDKDRVSPSQLPRLKSILDKHRGDIPVIIETTNGGGRSALFRLKNNSVKISNAFITEVSHLLGDEAIILAPKTFERTEPPARRNFGNFTKKQ